MVKTYLYIFFLLALKLPVSSQELDIGVYYGRFNAIYKFTDYGTGFRNPAGSQYSGYPSIRVNKKLKERVSVEATASYLAYQQYTATRLYYPGFFSVMHSGNISLTANYSFINTPKFESRFKAGVGLGIIPDTYQGEFVEIFLYPAVDSISRGTIKRDFTPLFPTLCFGVDFTYRIANRFKLSITTEYQLGFFKITEYDIYYNDGSGMNDQHARQWGNGNFYGFQLGLRYDLRTKKN